MSGRLVQKIERKSDSGIGLVEEAACATNRLNRRLRTVLVIAPQMPKPCIACAIERIRMRSGMETCEGLRKLDIELREPLRTARKAIEGALKRPEATALDSELREQLRLLEAATTGALVGLNLLIERRDGEVPKNARAVMEVLQAQVE